MVEWGEGTYTRLSLLLEDLLIHPAEEAGKIDPPGSDKQTMYYTGESTPVRRALVVWRTPDLGNVCTLPLSFVHSERF